MDPHLPHLISDCLIHVFTFLTEEDLISASTVCKDWHDAAETPWLWRRMCLERWGFCNLAVLGSERENLSWKKYFLRRCHLETKMTKGRSGGYTCKSLRGHTSRVVGLVYLQGNSSNLPDLWNNSATVCSASTDGTVRAWDIKNCELLWCSPVQSPLTGIICDEKHEVVITSDSTGLIKVWQGQTGQEVASFSTESSHSALLQYNINNDWFLAIGNCQGSVCILTDFTLTKISSIMVCDSFKVNILLVSPDKKWITAGTKENDDLSPKVIYTESLTSPSEDEDLLCQSVPVSGCQAAVFIPTQPARLAIVHHSEQRQNKALSVFDVTIKKIKYKSLILVQQVESFPLMLNNWSSEILLEAKSSNCIVLSAGEQLWVYSLKGALLASFKDHIMPISSICVDNFRVVTASRDLSMRVLTWRNDTDRGLTLESQYHLLGGSHTMSSGFTHVACDYSSIVASVEGKDGKDVLKAYSFTS
ncbi:F-box/WD repeat-containing protein 12 [Melanotaenia boesemani]|uniref:F-box/WD repeat-containing protein 12 n=1 Tax=Melanotaenia boesemani TaxID=1250792 RepID=UPI001C04490D|nr:F-box/WD repeat-containing protein 12 [Melanotaenia boesemani]